MYGSAPGTIAIAQSAGAARGIVTQYNIGAENQPGTLQPLTDPPGLGRGAGFGIRMGVGPTISDSAPLSSNYQAEFANTFGQATQAYANSMSDIAQATQTWSQQLSLTLERERATHQQEVAEITEKLAQA
jgi:hypothetical protein